MKPTFVPNGHGKEWDLRLHLATQAGKAIVALKGNSQSEGNGFCTLGPRCSVYLLQAHHLLSLNYNKARRDYYYVQ